MFSKNRVVQIFLKLNPQIIDSWSSSKRWIISCKDFWKYSLTFERKGNYIYLWEGIHSTILIVDGTKIGKETGLGGKATKSSCDEKKVKLPSKIPLLSDLLKLKGKNNRILKGVSKGCQLTCNGTGTLVTCPTCKRFQFHLDCLHKIVASLKLPTVDVEQK